MNRRLNLPWALGFRLTGRKSPNQNIEPKLYHRVQVPGAFGSSERNLQTPAAEFLIFFIKPVPLVPPPFFKQTVRPPGILEEGHSHWKEIMVHISSSRYRHLIILGLGILASLAIHHRAIVWVFQSWQASPRTDGQGPLIAMLGLIAWLQMRFVKEKHEPRYWSAGLLILAGALVTFVIAEHMDRPLLQAVTFLVSLIGVYTFVLGPTALTDLFPVWLLAIMALPGVPFIFNHRINPFFFHETNLLLNGFFKIFPAEAFQEKCHAASRLIYEGTYAGSPVFIFSLATFAAALCWRRFKISFWVMLFFWILTPVIRMVAVNLIVMSGQPASTWPFLSNVMVFTTAFVFYAVLTGEVLWLDRANKF